MAIISKLALNESISFASDFVPIEPVRLQHARQAYKEAAEEIFRMCYEIQVTGQLVDPFLLTKTLLRFLRARADREYLEAQKNCGPQPPSAAHETL